MENINFLGVSGVAFIVIMCWLIGLIAKAFDKLDNKWIPVICGVCGGALGAFALFFKATDFPATDYFNAVAIGIVSGLGSVGCHQIYKQLTNDPTEDYKGLYESAELDVMNLKAKLATTEADLDLWKAAFGGAGVTEEQIEQGLEALSEQEE